MPNTKSSDKTSRKNTVRTTVTFSKRDYVEIEEIATRKKVSVAWVIREAVEQYLNQQTPLLPR